MKLRNLKRKLNINKEKYIKIGSIIISVIVLVIGILLFTYAKYTSDNTFEIIDAKIENYGGDYTIAAYINGEYSSTIPEKNSNYSVEKVVCDNNAVGIWDKGNWRLYVENTTKSKTKCNIYFKNLYKEDILNGADPEVYDGMIAIKYVNNQPVKADMTSEWYSYK